MQRLRDWRLGLLLLDGILLVMAMTEPSWRLSRPIYDYLAAVDITRSMNVRDYRIGGQDVSRLEMIRRSLKQAARALPCGSRLGLALFTERRSAVLLMPVEVCGNYAPLAAAIEHIDWRMAWASDSNIIQGLDNLLELLKDLADKDLLHARLLFMTDGHEAPPPNPNYLPKLDHYQTGSSWRPNGLIVGVGGDELVRIPKFNEEGEMVGHYSEQDVTQISSFGLPKDPESIEGYHPRNAPWGNREVSGNEHLSSLKQDYLLELADTSGLGYLRLESAEQLARDLQQSAMAGSAEIPVRIHFIPAAVALFGLLAIYLAGQYRRRP